MSPKAATKSPTPPTTQTTTTALTRSPFFRGADLTATKTNNVGGTVVQGNNFNWTIQGKNQGTATATFTTGQVVLTDNLPSSGATYGATGTVTLAGGTAGTITCPTAGNNLVCTVTSATFALPVNGTFNVVFAVTPTAAGSLVNPRATGICRIDPNNNVLESRDQVTAPNNNDCADTVTVMPPTGTVSGRKYNDLDASGADNGGTDPGLSGWTIRAYADTNGDGILQVGETTISASATTAASTGAYSLTLNPGNYVICERIDNQPGFLQAQPNPTAAPIRCGSLPAAQGVAPGGYGVAVVAGGSLISRDFGNYRQGSVSGTKFNDPNGDGNLGDAAVPAGTTPWTIRAYTNATTPALVASTTTNVPAGTYSLNLNPGSYIICEVLQSGWTQTSPSNTNCGTVAGVSAGGHLVTVTSGSSAPSKDFANFALDVEIDVEKLVSVDGGTTWEDADVATGPTLLDGFDAPQFKFVLTNTGNVALSGVSLTDSDFGLAGCVPSVPTTLAVGASYECVLTGTWAAGQHTNMATASGNYTASDGSSYSDSDFDSAFYFGATVSVDVEKSVSVDGGTTFTDADAPTGPTLLQSGSDPVFRIVVTNNSNVTVEVDAVSDSDYDTANCLPAVPASLAAGASFTCEFSLAWAEGQHLRHRERQRGVRRLGHEHRR